MSNKTQCRTLICNLASALVTSSNRAIELGEAFDGSQNLIQLKIWCNLKFELGEAFDGSQNLIQLKIWCNLKFDVKGTF